MPLPVELPLDKHFGPDRIRDINKYAEERLRALKMSLADIRERKITTWRRIYTGMPREKTRSFPWQGASNLVVQLVGSFVDQLKAKIMMGVFGIDPLWDIQAIGKWAREEHVEEQRSAIQEWLIFSGLEPGYLNLVPKYSAWLSTMIRYGMGAMKVMPERDVEVVVSGMGGTSEFVRHDGAVALPLIFEDFLIPLTVSEMEKSPFTVHRSRCSRFDLEAMRRDRSYNRENVTKLLQSPTRQGPEQTSIDLQMDQGSRNPGDPTDTEWDIYECWFPFFAGGKKFQVILTCSIDPFYCLKAVFNWLPQNSLPFIKAVMGYDGERSTGFGFCEMLKDYQEEVSAIHNRRGDASTLANTNIVRVGSGTQLDTQFSVYPNAIFPGEQGAIEIIPLGRTANETIKDETMTLQLATDRAGIGPSSSGSGAGSVNKKGAYSAMGTYAIMQEGDTRANLNKTEFKQAHIMLARQKLLYDSWFGIPQKDYDKFGERAEFLKKALDAVKTGRLALPIRAATGSINKEVEKQNLMLLLNNFRAHWQQQNQVLQALQNPMMAPDQKEYLWGVFQAANWVMAKVGKDFGLNDPSVAVPELAAGQIKALLASETAKHAAAQEIAQQIGGQQQPQQQQAQPPVQQQPAPEPAAGGPVQ